MRLNTKKGNMPAIVLIVILIVAGGVFMFTRNKSSDTTKTVESSMPISGTETKDTLTGTTPVAPKEVTVVYSASGFSPATVTIKKGDTVIFQNKTGKKASVASNPHPTHTLYPEFDQYKTDQRGKDEFRFVFEKVGAWGYHDHLNASMGGTVIVTE